MLKTTKIIIMLFVIFGFYQLSVKSFDFLGQIATIIFVGSAIGAAAGLCWHYGSNQAETTVSLFYKGLAIMTPVTIGLFFLWGLFTPRDPIYIELDIQRRLIVDGLYMLAIGSLIFSIFAQQTVSALQIIWSPKGGI